MNITLPMIWCQIVIQLVHMRTFWGGSTEWFHYTYLVLRGLALTQNQECLHHR
jgi:hypothetical protein